ncbi:MAG: hypothetical protein JXJ17_04875 [Anaerolineae bacterium]|nr:hypothetical protein [Anaerolineae bacterium]
MRKALRWLTLDRLLVILAFLAVFAMAMRTPLDTDMLWHLRAGQWQVENRALLRVDLFSYSRAGTEWINHSWLSQVILYGLYAGLGNVGLAFYTALLATGGLAFVYRQCRGDSMIKAFVIILAAAAAAIFWSPRPQMFSFFFSAVVLYLLRLYQQKGIDRLWFIPLIVALWVNFHGGFAIGFILMVLATVGEFLRWFFDVVIDGRGEADADKRRAALIDGLRPVGRLVVIGLVSAAAVSLNPYGPRMLLYPFQTVGIGVLQDFIQEWASPNFHRPETWPFIWMLLGTLIAAALSPRRIDWRDVVLVGGTAYSALLAGRNIATFAIVAAPVLSIHLADWLEERGWMLRLKRPPRGMFVAINWLIVLLAAGAVVVKSVAALNAEQIETARRDLLPVEAVDYLHDHQPPGPLFNSYNWGGYLIWELREYPVYVDGRTDLYDDEMLRGYLNTVFAQPGWQDRLDEIGANTVLIETSGQLAQVLLLDDRWNRVYNDEKASIFVREVLLAE